MIEYMEALLRRLEGTTEPDREVDCAIAVQIGGFHLTAKGNYAYKDKDGALILPGHGGDQLVPRYTESLDACRRLIRDQLPGWWYAGGHCVLTDHASIGPDFRSDAPGIAELVQETEEKTFPETFDADIEGANECIAMLHVIVQAKIALAKRAKEMAAEVAPDGHA